MSRENAWDAGDIAEGKAYIRRLDMAYMAMDPSFSTGVQCIRNVPKSSMQMMSLNSAWVALILFSLHLTVCGWTQDAVGKGDRNGEAPSWTTGQYGGFSTAKWRDFLKPSAGFYVCEAELKTVHSILPD